MNTMTRWEPFRGFASLQDQVNRLFEDRFTRGRTDESDLATWARAVDICETEDELLVKADLPGMDEKDIDIRIESNTLTIRGERTFANDVSRDNYLRLERAYGPFTRSFSLPNTVNVDAIHAEYGNGVLTVHMAKHEESKPKQVKIGVSPNGQR
jgi:HSP20 family protein